MIFLVVSWCDLILLDEYNYFSLKNGVIFSGVKIVEYSYNNIEYLKNKLE